MLPRCYSFQPQYLHLEGGLKLHYLDEGEGPVVVLVHGNPTWSYYFRDLVEELRVDHRVIAIDHIGCGHSDKPQEYEYTLENHIKNLSALIASLHVSCYSLVLHDWGGAIGMGLAGRNCSCIKKIVLMNTAAFRSRRIPLRIRLCRIPLLGEVLVRFFNGFAWPATFMAVEKRLPKEVKKAYIAPYNSWANRIAVHRFVVDIPDSPKHQTYPRLLEIENSLQLVKQAGIPMLILWGGRDFCFTKHFYQEWLRRFPEARSVYYPDAGHYLLEDRREDACRQIRAFLSS
ncbi:MAG: alpha/beta hydrolase [Deltaproteobacteria bacterium]|nr:MAG: alpha/beta hydrolase [Deltaproteobacteria bacterium]